MWLWLVIGCPKKEPDAVARLEQLLKAADSAWERRGEIGFEEASEPLLEAYGLVPTDPGVLWRVARWRTAEGMAAEDPDIARSAFAEARASAASCLEGQPGFVQRRNAEGWAAALADTAAIRAPCAVWTAFPWVRWMELQGGAAASLDLEPIDALLASVQGAGDPDVESVAIWAEGLLLAIRPTWAGRDPEAARERLAQAVKMERKAVVRVVDLYGVLREVGTPEQQADLRNVIRALPATSPEDIRAKAKLEAEPAD